MLLFYNIHLSMENFVETRGEIDLKYIYELFEYWKYETLFKLGEQNQLESKIKTKSMCIWTNQER